MTIGELVWRVSQTKRTKICQKLKDSWLGRCKVHNVLSKGRCSLHNVETGALGHEGQCIALETDATRAHGVTPAY